ncbi:MAG: DEAD/DEAH box helicase [Alphaproteobacteria bacterium]|nr:DEAD/DEAH box helicase [Armatimonadota bacterium]MBM3508291.1 DEAD/DEAH box helicase [Alphaproteobacteria bacterium]
MTVAGKGQTPFTDADRLRLLQLQTRRAMADRRVKSTEVDAPPPGGQTACDTDLERWRLLPESLVLHAWQKECLAKWLPLGCGTVKVATGGGKTIFALAAAQALQNSTQADLRLVIVVPTIPLMNQWYDDLREGTVPASAIGFMGAGRAPPQASSLRILLCVLNSAREKLPEFVASAGWGPRMLLVVDECHRSGAEQAQRIFDSHPRYTLGLSATPEQDGEDEEVPSDQAYERGVVGRALGPIIFDFTLRMSLEAGLLTPFEVWHVALPLAPEEAVEHSKLSREISDLRKSLQPIHVKSRSKQGFIAWCQTQASRGGANATQAERFIGLANSRKDLLYRAKSRTEVVLGLLRMAAADPESRAIVFHERIEEIERLYLLAEECNFPVLLEHSQLPDSVRTENIEAFRRGVARTIISAKSLVEGFNVPSADLGVIAASSSSVRQRIQSLGRMLRRKEGGRTARIVVLYVGDTEDEAIYEKADWESVIGASRNRYFAWRPMAVAAWPEGLVETGKPPRKYRPPSSLVDASTLKLGDPYPGQVSGLDLKVDQGGTLRTDDGMLVPAPPELVTEIVARNRYRRARRTPAGHLIVRVDSSEGECADWRFLGLLALPDPNDSPRATMYGIRSVSGRRVISESTGHGSASFALGPGQARSLEAGAARDELLDWIKSLERERGVKINKLFWNGTTYWVEIKGEQAHPPGLLPALEFSP